MSEWRKLHAKITESEAGAPSFDETFPEGPTEWDLVEPDGLDYQGLEGNWLLSPNSQPRSRVSGTYSAATEIHPGRTDNPDVSLPGPCQSAFPSWADHTPRAFSSYSLSLSEAHNAQRETVDSVQGRERDGDLIMGGNTNTETASIPAPQATQHTVHPQYWAGGRIYWWKQRFVEIATPNDRDRITNGTSQVLKEVWYVGGQNGFPGGEEKTK